MKIQLDLTALSNSLEIITRLAPPTSGNVTFSSNGKKVHILSSADLSRCESIVPCEVDGEGEFAIPLQALRDATRGRDKLEIEYKNSVLAIRSGRYKAELNAVDVIPLDPLDPEEGKELKVTTEQSGWLKKVLKEVALKPTTMFSAWMPVAVKMTPKSAFISCFDVQHMSWASSKKVTGDFECVLPLDTLTSVIDLFNLTTFTIKQTTTRIEVSNKLTKVFLNAPTLEGLPTLDEVRQTIKDAEAASSTAFKCSKKDLLSYLDNAKAVIGKERAEIEVQQHEKGVSFTINTGQGKSTAVLKGSGKGGFKIDYSYLMEALAKAGDELVMDVVHNEFMSMKLNGSSIMIALNQ